MRDGELIKSLDQLDALFSDESKWTKGADSRTSDGVSTNVMFGECWCLSGGCVALKNDYEALWNALKVTARVEYLSFWNDAPERTFADIKRLIADTRKRLTKVTD